MAALSEIVTYGHFLSILNLELMAGACELKASNAGQRKYSHDRHQYLTWNRAPDPSRSAALGGGV